MIESLREVFRTGTMRAVLVEDVLRPDVCELLRARVRPGLTPYWLADRGRYQVNDSLEEPEIAGALADICGAILEAPVVAGRPRWQRLVHGDYALYKDDACRWRDRLEPFEAVLDFSAAGSAEAQIVYINSESGFIVPQQPGILGLVDRRSGVQRYDRYLTARVRDAEVFRLSLPLSNR